MSVLRAKVAEDGRKGRSRDYYIEAVREYFARYGEVTAACFAPASAKRNGRPDLVERYYAGRESGDPWPSLNALKKNFGGSFVNVLRAAGLPENSTGPARGRRAPGEAEPILHVRERIRYMPSDRVLEAQKRVRRAEERAERLRARLEKAERVIAEMRERRAPVQTVVRDRPVKITKTKTITKTVKVRDERALERLRVKLADSEAARRALADQAKAEARDRTRAEREVENLRAEQAALAAEARSAAEAADRASDRLAAAEARAERLAVELEQAREQLLGASEAAIASDLVRQAEARVNEAEVRAARAEREMAEQAAAITGELRKLTQVELAELRVKGPAGPVVMAKALKRLALARSRGGTDPLRAALLEVARAAVTWLDRL